MRPANHSPALIGAGPAQPLTPHPAEILKILLRDETLADDVDLQVLAQKTESFSGSDLKRACPPTYLRGSLR